MESFKLVIDGIDLTKEDRRRIEKGIERAMVEALAGKTKGMVFRPVIQPGRAARHDEAAEGDGAAEGVEGESFSRIRDLLPNGGILIRELLAQKGLDVQIKDGAFNPEMRLGETMSVSEILNSPALGKGAASGQVRAPERNA